MFTTIRLSGNTDPQFRASVNELFQSTSRTLIYTIGGVYLAFILATVIWPEEIGVNTWVVVPASLAVLLLTLWLLPRNYLIAHITLQVGLAGSITLAVHLFQKPEIAFFYALLPMIAIVCLGWRSGSLAWVIDAGAVYWLHNGLLAQPPTFTLSLVVVIGGAISGLLGWASMRAVLTVTEWSLYSFRQAQDNLEDVRNHRAQLAHVVKELNSANARLERVNQMLVLARAEAEEAKDARNRFALAISHELRTPLNFIISFSEIMVKTPDTYAPLGRWPAGLYDDVQEIYRSSQHLMRLVNDVLDLGQIENLRMNLIKEWISLSQVIAEVIGMVQRAFDLKGIDLRAEVEPDLPLVFVDRTRIRQVLLNLVNNSLRFTDKGGVTLRLRRHEGNTLLISVEDTGTGIAQEDLPKIFEEFQQVSNDSWRRREGAGLGIPISKSFIELHGGQMWVESELGKGTRFFFTIPVIAASEVSGAVDKEREERYWRTLKEKAEKGKNVLVISQDPSAGDILAPYIEGYSLLAALPSDDIVSRAAALLPFAIFMDQAVAEDPQVQSKVARLPYDLPVISFSFPGNPTHPQNLPDCVRYYLVKPFSNQVLVDAITSLGGGVRRLLVVDDDSAMVNLVARALRSKRRAHGDHRYDLVTAATGEEAIRRLGQDKPDAILLDVSLPDISGMEVLEEAQRRGLPVIFITAHEWRVIFPETEREALSVRMRRPLSRNELPTVLKNLLEVIHPKYPADLSELIRPTTPTG